MPAKATALLKHLWELLLGEGLGTGLRLSPAGMFPGSGSHSATPSHKAEPPSPTCVPALGWESLCWALAFCPSCWDPPSAIWPPKLPWPRAWVGALAFIFCPQ